MLVVVLVAGGRQAGRAQARFVRDACACACVSDDASAQMRTTDAIVRRDGQRWVVRSGDGRSISCPAAVRHGAVRPYAAPVEHASPTDRSGQHEPCMWRRPVVGLRRRP